MQLIMAPPSPFARKVRVLLRETNQLDAVEEVDIATTPYDPHAKALAANPTAKIPSLIRTDGPAIYDSRVITRYLDDRAQSGLYPTRDLWDVLTLEATGDTMMDAAVSISYETRARPANLQSMDWVNAQWGKITGACTALEQRWMPHLVGPLTMGQISVACALGYLDLRHDARGWRQRHDALADWYAKFAERDSMKDTFVAP